jgi:hypothetical protein
MTLDTWMPTDIRLDTGDTAGANNSVYPQITCSGSNVYAVWYDYRNGSYDIYFNHSSDSGATWQSSDIRLDTGDAAGASNSYSPQIAYSGNNVYAVWYDSRDGNYDIYFNYSTDCGATWPSSDIRVDCKITPGVHISKKPQIACSGNNVYAVWQDLRYGSYDIYFNYSTDGGVSWQATDIRLDTGDAPGANDSVNSQITCSVSNIYVVWEEWRNGDPDIYFNYSTDGGVNWQSSDIRLDSDDIPGAKASVDPQIACSGNNVYVVWEDNRNGAPDIYFNYSTDGGAHWQKPDYRLDTGDTAGANQSYRPQITCSENNVYAVWYDDRNGLNDIYLNYTTDYGATWQSSDIRLDTGDTAGASSSQYPQIDSSGSNVYAVWKDNRNGSYDIYFNHSSDSGATWQSSDIRLDTGDTAGANKSEYPQIACSRNNVYAVWEDYRNGFYADIYFNRAIPGTDIKANGSDGPISITESDTLQIRVSLTTYGSTANVDFWLAYKGPSGWIHYNNSTKKWEAGLGVTHQGALMDLNNKKVFQKSGLTPGNYMFYFGVDLNMNGKITKSSLYKDEVKVTVTQ